ncbi:MAG: MFS transporter [Sciscionella sp.]
MSARTAVLMVFALHGAVYGSWAARVPALAEQVDARPGGLGLALLGTSIGMVAAALLTGRLCAAVGSRIVVIVCGLGCSLLVPLLGLASSIPLLGVTLAGLGAMVGAMDVSMNVAATTVIRRLSRPIMPQFHAFFSFGGLAGALGAGVAAAHHWSPLRHLLVVAVLGVSTVLLAARSLPVEPKIDEPAPHPSRRDLLRRPLLWLLATIALCSAIAEGVNAEWSALFLVRERHVAEAAATTAYSLFSLAMALTRLFGERFESSSGPYRVLVTGAVIAATGLLAAAVIPVAAVGYAGFALAGTGLAFCFPMTLGLAGRAGQRADGTGGEQEIGFVTTIAYSGFLSGPPLVGWIAQATNLAVALGVVGGIVALVPLAVRASALARRREEHAHLPRHRS